MTLIFHCNGKDTKTRPTLCFGCSETIYWMGFLRKKMKIDIFLFLSKSSGFMSDS